MEMEKRLLKIKQWLLTDCGLHALYVDVIVEELDVDYLRPASFMCKRDFSDCFQRFRGDSEHIFNLMGILTLFVLGKETECNARRAMCEGAECCDRKMAQLCLMEKDLAVFGLRMTMKSKQILLERSLKLQPAASHFSPMLVGDSVVQPKGRSVFFGEPWQLSFLHAVSRFVWTHCSSSPFSHQPGMKDLRFFMENFYSSYFPERSVWAMHSPWCKWTPENHRNVARDDAHVLVRTVLALLARHRIRGDLAMDLVSLIFDSSSI